MWPSTSEKNIPPYLSLLVSPSFSRNNVCKNAVFFLAVSFPKKAFVSESAKRAFAARAGLRKFLENEKQNSRKIYGTMFTFEIQGQMQKLSSFRGQTKNRPKKYLRDSSTQPFNCKVSTGVLSLLVRRFISGGETETGVKPGTMCKNSGCTTVSLITVQPLPTDVRLQDLFCQKISLPLPAWKVFGDLNSPRPSLWKFWFSFTLHTSPGFRIPVRPPPPPYHHHRHYRQFNNIDWSRTYPYQLNLYNTDTFLLPTV